MPRKGRPPIPPDTLERARELARDHPMATVARKLGVSISGLYKNGVKTDRRGAQITRVDFDIEAAEAMIRAGATLAEVAAELHISPSLLTKRGIRTGRPPGPQPGHGGRPKRAV